MYPTGKKTKKTLCLSVFRKRLLIIFLNLHFTVSFITVCSLEFDEEGRSFTELFSMISILLTTLDVHGLLYMTKSLPEVYFSHDRIT